MTDQEKILKNLYDVFTENYDEEEGIEARLLPPEETGLETTVLTTLHPGFGTTSNLAEGEYYFEDDTFVIRVILVPEMDTRNLPTVCSLIGVENADTPVGSFAYDHLEGALIYNLRVPIVDGLSEKDAAELCDRCVAIALTMAERNCSDLIRCATA